MKWFFVRKGVIDDEYKISEDEIVFISILDDNPTFLNE